MDRYSGATLAAPMKCYHEESVGMSANSGQLILGIIDDAALVRVT